VSWDAAARILAEAVGSGGFPGGVALVGDRGRTVWRHAVGLLAREPEPGAPVSVETIYDVASLTKAVVTTSLVMRLVEAGRLALDTPASAFLPELSPPGGAITVRHLLTHSSGLPAWRPFYEKASSRDEILRLAAAEPLEAEPGARSVYSDLGFILLGFVVERAGGARLDAMAQRALFEPLGMEACRFVDLEGPPAPFRAPVAPTEICPRRGLVHGEVHDDNCHAAGGVLGHAGLFASAPDLARFAAAMCAAHAGERLVGGFPPELVRTFFAPAGIPASTWRLGWDGPAETGSSLGQLWPTSAVGHLGFTGCSIWLDPPRGRYAILLTNRVHPSRADERIKEVRPRFHDAVWRALQAR
jgi:CubicO group peptidase (beta-lactamase class C family)